MEPFKLTLQQITFEQDQLDYAPQLDSFDNVVNYDSCFSADSPPTASVTTATTYSTTAASPFISPGTRDTRDSVHSPYRQTSPQFSSEPVWSSPAYDSPPYQQHLINPDDNYIKLTETRNGPHTPQTAAQDIAFLSQVSANTTAVGKHINTKKKRKFVGKTTVISSTSTAITTMPSETPPLQLLDKTPDTEDNSSFETVAEALRLQWSVIGNKDITPASPDVVAQIVAEAEKRLKSGDGSGRTTPSLATQSGLATPTVPTPRGTTPTILKSGEVTPTILKSGEVTPTLSNNGTAAHMQQETNGSTIDTAQEERISNQWGTTPQVPETTSPSLPNVGATSDQSQRSSPFVQSPPQTPVSEVSKEHVTMVTAKDGTKTPDNIDAKELIRIPAESITLTTSREKTTWFGGKESKGDKSHKTTKEKSRRVSEESGHNVGMNGSEKPDDSRSVSSMSSEQELDRYVPSETDAFLKALPPVKAVDMSQFVQHRHSPPVKETSFKPVHTVATPPAFTTKATASDSGVDMTGNSMLQQPLTSTPYAMQTDKQPIFVPQIGPLFPKTEHVYTRHIQHPVSITKSEGNPQMKKQLEEVLREKAKLEGQLEVLTHEAQSTLQERAELQAQLASLRLKLLSQKGGEHDPEKESLKRDVDMLKRSRETIEESMRETQKLLEEKLQESKLSHEELQMTQDAHDKLQLKMKDLRDDLMTKEVSIQALKNKVAELYVEVQNGLQSKIELENESRSAKSDLLSLVKTKEWYQQQLQLAHDVRTQLQKELTILQAQSVSQNTIVERMKTDNARLRVQLNEAQQRALKQKEMLAKHLETIESDMMEREAAFQEIQRERTMIEDTFNSQINSVENERSRLTLLMQINNDLEARLDKAQEDLKKKHSQIFALENEQMEVMKKLTVSQEILLDRERELEDVSQKLIEVEAQLKAFKSEITEKDKEILKLREEKASAQILYQAVKEEKTIVDSALEKLQQDMHKVEKSFKMMKSELGMKIAELEKASTDKSHLQKEVEIIRKDLSIKNRSYDSMHKDYDGKNTAVQQLQIENTSLQSELKIMKDQLVVIQSSEEASVIEKKTIVEELNETKHRLEIAERNLSEKSETVTVQQTSSVHQNSEVQQSSSVVENQKFQEVVSENQNLREQISELEQQSEKDQHRYSEESQRLGNDLKSLKEELTSRQATFEENVESLSTKLREVISEKQMVETELEMTRRKFELSSVEQQDQMTAEMQKLASELETARLSQQELHNQLLALQHAKETEVTYLRQELSALEEALQQAREDQVEKQKTEELNQDLSLELEKERGRLAGLLQNNSALKQHVSQLEEALARRESSLVEVHSQLTEAMQGQDHTQQDYLRRIQGLEDLLQKEKDGQRDLRKQIGSKISENKRLKKQCEAAKQDTEQMKQDLETREATMMQLRADLDSSRQVALSHQGQLTTLTSENKSLEQEVERVRRDLADNIARSPVLMEEIQSLQWQLTQKHTEVEQVQEQLRLAEHRQHTELDSLKKALQEKQEEIDALKQEVSSTRKDKLSQKARVSELRSALKSSVQHHKLAKKIQAKKKELASAGGGGGGGDGLVTSSGEDKGTQVNFDAPEVALPPPSFDLEAVEQLLQDTAVKALESKPLDNLQTCLSSLRTEISGLQKQMDKHTTAVHTSNKSWRSIETEVNELREVVNTVASTMATSGTTTTNSTDTEEVQSNVQDI